MFERNTRAFDLKSRPHKVAFIGIGHNCRQRVLPAFRRVANQIEMIGFDLVTHQGDDLAGLTVYEVADDHELLQQLIRHRPTAVVIETPDDYHARHIRLALQAGVPSIFCEKTLASSAQEAETLLPACQAAEPHQQVSIIDHYTCLPLLIKLATHAHDWLGKILRIDVELFEAQGIPPHQQRSHALGMANFFHHTLALAARWFEPQSLEPVQAVWVVHPEATAPDTFRAAKFADRSTGQTVARLAVGKYMSSSRKLVRVVGTHGTGTYDRSRNELQIERADGTSLLFRRTDADTGYERLANSLAGNSSNHGGLTVLRAFHIQQLIDSAQSQAVQLTTLPPHSFDDFWEPSVRCEAPTAA